MGLTIDSKLKSTAGGAIMKAGLILKSILFFCVILTSSSEAWNYTSHENPFTPVFGTGGLKLKGDFASAGNSVLCQNNGQNKCNNNYNGYLYDSNLMAKNEDSTIATNSSKATVVLPTGVKKDDIVWAGLYWQGHIASKKPSDYANFIKDRNKVSIKLPDGTLKNITADKVWYHDFGMNNTCTNNNYNCGFRSFYQGYKDITTDFKTNFNVAGGTNQTVSVGNIKSTVGEDWYSYAYVNPTISGQGFRVGFWGSWNLVVIYKNSAVDAKVKTVNVYQGFDLLMPVPSNNNNNAAVTHTINIPITGLKTPKSGTINAKMMFYASGGEKLIQRDSLSMKNANNSYQFEQVTNGANPLNNPFNDTISNNGIGVDPGITFYPGTDIDTFDISNKMTYDQTATEIQLSAIFQNGNGDQSTPGLVVFSADLYMPELCYDVSATIDGEYMQKGSWDRSFVPHQHKGNLTNKVFIRNLEGDFRYIKSSLKANWTYIAQYGDSGPTPTIAYVEGSEKVQNPGVYAYTKPKLTSETGRFYIGNEEDPIYGIIKPYESLYAISSHNVNDVYGKTIQVDIDVNASLNLDPSDTTSLTSYRYKTSDGTLKMCKGELSYSPKWYQFNVESPGAQKGDYRLFTQVTGTDYNLNVVSYTKDTNSQYTTKTSFNGAMEVELFEVPSFQSLGVYDSIKYDFDRICEDSNSSKPWSDGLHFSRFKNTTSTSLGIDTKDNRFAMQNAGLRLWVLMADYDGDGVKTDITKYNYCENVNDGDSDGSCFKNLWKNDTYYKTQTTCSVPCSKTDKDCYQCLKENYSQPICSRDNFSVRPYAVQVEALNNAYDGSGNLITTKSIQKNNKASTDIHNLISGDDISYKATYEAKSAPDPVSKTYSTPAGYFFKIYATEAMNEANGAFGNLVRFFGLKFDNDKTNSKDYTKCDDSTHKRFKLGTKGYEVKNDNVGNYDVVLVDKDWTLVDQATYLHKPVFDYNGKKRVDDCNPNNTLTNNSGLQGCDTQSFEANEDVNFYEIPVKFLPDQIDVSTLAQKSVLNDGTSMGRLWTYINNLNDTQDMAAALQGSLKAQNAKDTTTSNFTAGCFAQNVRLFARYTSPEVTYNDTTSKIQATASSATNLQYVQNFNNISSSSTEIQTEHFVTDAVAAKNDSSENVQTDGINTDKEINIIVLKDNFLDSNKGTLAYDLRMNFNKVIAAAVSPIHILFVKITSLLTDEEVVTTANYPTAYRLGCDKDDYICLKTKNPDKLFEIADNSQLYTKNSTIDATVDREEKAFKFLYGRVYTDLEKFGSEGKPVTGNTASTTFDTLVYSNATPDGSLKDILDTVAADASWYRAKTHSAMISKDGQIDKLSVYSKTTGDPSIFPSSVSILFDDLATGGRTSSVTFDNSGNAKPNKVTFQINPSIWLRYKTTTSSSLGEPRFTINFIENGYNWVGKGKTGNVVKQVPQGATKNRLNW